jgi:CBS domain-containing protein
MSPTTSLGIPVSRIMRGPVATVDQGRTIREVAAALAADEIGAVLVDGSHGPVGIVSERDIVTALGTGEDPDALQARDLMNTDLIMAGPDEPVLGIVDLMLAAGIRHVPVVADGSPVGMVSTRDVVVAARAVEEPGPPTLP